MRQTISKHYVAAHYYSSQGYSITDAILQLRNSITGSVSQDRLMDMLLDVHKPAYDAHVSYIFRTQSNSQSFYKHLEDYLIYGLPQKFVRNSGSNDYISLDGSIAISSCDRLKPQLATFDSLDQKFVFVGQFRRDEGVGPRLITCTDRQGQGLSLEAREVELNTLEDGSDEFHFEMSADSSYLFVRLPKMTPGVSADQKSLLNFIDNTPADHEFPIIFDLRQNGGGDDSFAYDLGESLRSNTQHNPPTELIDMESLYATASSTNLAFAQWQKLLQNGDPNAPRYEEKYQAYWGHFQEQVAQGLTLDSEPTIATHTSTHGVGKRPRDWSKPIVLLVDKGCASSCESMIEIFSTVTNAKVIGTHSGGYLSFGNIGVVMLPNSKIGFQGGWRYFKSAGEEGLGYEPGIYDVGSDILATAVQYVHQVRSSLE